jgi:rubrerythrin
MYAAMEDEAEAQHRPEKWRCPKCGNVITTHVPLSQTPTCHSPQKHDRKKFLMEKIK